MRSYYHITLDKEFKEDCSVWLTFLDKRNIMSVFRPFVDTNILKSVTELFFYSDASGSLRNRGFGAVFEKRWIFRTWSHTFLKEEKPSIEYLELAALVLAVFTWIDKLVNSRVVLFCDNKLVVDMLWSTGSGCKRCMRLIRILTLTLRAPELDLYRVPMYQCKTAVSFFQLVVQATQDLSLWNLSLVLFYQPVFHCV